MTGSPQSGEPRRSFLGELKRRHVFRVLAVYVAVALGVLQAASLTFGPLHLPDWTLTFVVVLALLGLPVAAVLAWAFETSPEGVRPTAGGGSGLHAAGLLVGAVLLTVAAGLGVRSWLGSAALPFPGRGAATTASDTRSALTRLAVLPLENHSADPDDAYFAGAMTDEITRALATVPGFEVSSRTSAATFADSKATAPRIADSLGVTYLLEGGASLADGRAAITAQLIDGRADTTVWTGRFERPSGDVQELEVDVARRIARALRSSLTQTEERAIVADRTDDPVAYDLFLRADGQAGQDSASMARRIDLLRRAVARDSSFTWAWLWLGATYGNMPGPGSIDSSRIAFAHATRHASTPRARALALGGPDFFGGNLDSAIAIVHEALAATPDDPILVPLQAGARALRGDLVSALRLRRRARDLDPLNAATWAQLGKTYFELGMDQEAERSLRRALALDNTSLAAWSALRELRRDEDRCGEAMALEDSLVSLAGDAQELGERGSLQLCMGHAAAGWRLLDSAYRSEPWSDFAPWTPELVRAREITGDTAGTGDLVRRARAALRPHAGATSAPFFQPIELAAVLGHGAEAARLLRDYMERGGESLRAMVDDPDFGAVRSDTAFQAAVREARARLRDQRRQARRTLAGDDP